MSVVLSNLNNGICTLTINRPESLNALNEEVLQSLSNHLDSIEKDNNIRAVIITGSGTKAFVAGADIKEFANFSVQEGARLAEEGQKKIFDKIENFPKPVLAAINGFALGGGLELALACHIRIAADGSKMGLPEVSLGLIPGYGGTQRLPKIVGKGLAFEIILSAKPIDAQRAYEIGLVNSVESPELLLIETQNWAEQICKNAPSALKNAIIAINASLENSNGFAKEQELFGELFQTPNFKEGVTAFLEKRKPTF